jgi:hypothetical protein
MENPAKKRIPRAPMYFSKTILLEKVDVNKITGEMGMSKVKSQNSKIRIKNEKARKRESGCML